MAAIPAQEPEGLVAKAVLAGRLLHRAWPLVRGPRSKMRRGLARSRSLATSPDSPAPAALATSPGGIAPKASAAMSSAHSQTGRASPAMRRASSRAASQRPCCAAGSGTLTRTRSAGSVSGVGASGNAACSIASAAQTVRPRSASAKASSVSGDAWATARRATDHEISDESTAARSCGSSASASHTRDHSRSAWAVTPSRSRA